MGSNTTNVAVFKPGRSVTTMQDELADGSVDAAITAAVAAYKGVDSDGQVPVIEYPSDFDDAIKAAVKYTETTPGNDLIVVVTDFECDDPDAVERLLAESDDMFVLVPVSNQGYNKTWAAKLDNDDAGPNNVDVIEVSGLGDPSVALAEVGPFLAKASA